MTRVEHRVCDRCGRQDEGAQDHGWTLLEIEQGDFDLCRSCGRDLISWISAGRPDTLGLPS